MILFVILLQIVLRFPFQERGTPTRSPFPRTRNASRSPFPGMRNVSRSPFQERGTERFKGGGKRIVGSRDPTDPLDPGYECSPYCTIRFSTAVF